MIRRAPLLLAASLFACGQATPPPKAPETPPAAPSAPTAEAAKPAKLSPEEARSATLTALLAAINAHDAKKAAECYAETGTMLLVGGQPVAGRDAIMAVYQQRFTAFPDFAIGATRILPNGEMTGVQWIYNGTHKGELFGIKATEKKTGAAGADVLTFDGDGKVKVHNLYTDPATTLGQLGIHPRLKARDIPAMPSSPETVAPAGADGAKNIEVAKGFLSAMDAKKEADAVALVTDDLVWEDYSAPGPIKGKAEGKKLLKEVATVFPDAKHTITNIFAVGSYVVAEDYVEATHKQLEKPVKARGVQVFEIKDGKIAKGWNYSSSLDVAMQLGLIPPPGAPPAPATAPAKK